MEAITSVGEISLGVGEIVCEQGLFYVGLRMSQGQRGAEVVVRPATAIVFAAKLFLASLKGLLFRK